MFDIKLADIMVVNETKKLKETNFVLVDFGFALPMTHRFYRWETRGTLGYVRYIK